MDRHEFFDPYQEAADAALGRRAPYSQLGDWVGLSGVEAGAKDAYWVMFMHAFSEGDMVAPPRETLALLYGAKQPRTVDVYIRQLEVIGAISASRKQVKGSGELRSKNTYQVHQTPPRGWAGPKSIVDLHRWRRIDPEGMTRYYTDRRTWLKDVEADYQQRLKDEHQAGLRGLRDPMSLMGRRAWLRDAVRLWRTRRHDAPPAPFGSALDRTAESTGRARDSTARSDVRSSALRGAAQRTTAASGRGALSTDECGVRQSAHEEEREKALSATRSTAEVSNERETSGSDQADTRAVSEAVAAAWADAREWHGHAFSRRARVRVARDAGILIAEGEDVGHLIAAAADMARYARYLDLAKHLEHFVPPRISAARPGADPAAPQAYPWCENRECDPISRLCTGADAQGFRRSWPCPVCHSATTHTARIAVSG